MRCSTLLVFAWLIAAHPAAHAAPPAEAGSTPRKAPSGLAARLWTLTDLVLDHHIDPPARQEMILAAIKSLYDAAGLAPPSGLARQVSALTGPDPLAPVLDEAWSRLPSDKIKVRDVEIEPVDQVIGGLVEALPGGARLLSAQEVKVQEQFAGNRYVGLHIALSFDKEARRATIAQVFKGGPADLAGVKQGDVIEEIDGAGTEGQPVQKVVERLRGPEGSAVTIRVRQPKATEARVFTITRGVLPQKMVEGKSRRLDEGPETFFPWDDSIGYLKFGEVLGSTPHELRVLARRLEEEGAKAVILDFRYATQAHLHPTVLVADALLEAGTIGRMRTAGGAETFRAEPDALFRGCPLAVLVEPETLITLRWLAAALQDNHRAIIVGSEDEKGTRSRAPQGDPRGTNLGEADVVTTVPIGDGSTSIKMATGRLERGDGRPLARGKAEAKGALVPDIATPPPPPPRRMIRPNPGNRATPRGAGTGSPVEETTESKIDDKDASVNAALLSLRKMLKSP